MPMKNKAKMRYIGNKNDFERKSKKKTERR